MARRKRDRDVSDNDAADGAAQSPLDGHAQRTDDPHHHPEDSEALDPAVKRQHLGDSVEREISTTPAPTPGPTPRPPTPAFLRDLHCATESFRGMKDTNEDRHVAVVDAFPGPVFGVFDGHGGVHTAEYLVRHLIKTTAGCIRQQLGTRRVDALNTIRSTWDEEAAVVRELREHAEVCRRQLEELGSVDDTGDPQLRSLREELIQTITDVDKRIQEVDNEQEERLRKLRRVLDEAGVPIRKALTEGFQRTDAQILQSNPTRDGSTAVLIWFLGHERSDLSLYSVNVGDSRAVLCRDGLAVAVTRDHKPSEPDERQRIIKAGGFVTAINGVPRVHSAVGAGLTVQPEAGTYLAVSRAFGDRSLKKPTACVTSEPEIRHYRIGESDELLVIATDGIWDVLTNQEAVEIALEHLDDPKAGADAIVREAYRRGSLDNLTATVIIFGWNAERTRRRLQERTGSGNVGSERNKVVNNKHKQDGKEEDEEEMDMFNL